MKIATLAVLLGLMGCAPCPAAERIYSAQVVSVRDGDTSVIQADLGLDVFKTETIRLAGLDAPELSTREGKAAKEFLSKLILGKSIMARAAGREKYGRLLAEIWLGDINVNALLLEKGYAKKYHGEKRISQ